MYDFNATFVAGRFSAFFFPSVKQFSRIFRRGNGFPEIARDVSRAPILNGNRFCFPFQSDKCCTALSRSIVTVTNELLKVPRDTAAVAINGRAFAISDDDNPRSAALSYPPAVYRGA